MRTGRLSARSTSSFISCPPSTLPTLPLDVASEWFRSPPWPVGFFIGPQTEATADLVMKRATSLSLLLSRETPWLRWWQELILNWVASWSTVGDLTVSSADGEDYTAWELPTDLELKRLELEELLESR